MYLEKPSVSLNKQIYKIAYPSILGYVGLILFETINIFWVGRIDPKAVAGVAAAAFINWTAYAVMNLSTTGCSTLVAQNFGAGNKKIIFDVVREAFWLSLIISLLIVLILVVSIPAVFNLMGLDAETYRYAMGYFKIITAGFPILYLFNLQGFVFNGYGDTKTSTRIVLIALAINIILDPLLMFGWIGFPKLGVAGAALATIISETIGIMLRTYYLRKKGYIDSLKSFLQLSSGYIKKILAIGIPVATTNAVWSFVFPLLTIIITKFGMAPLAGLNIGNRIEGIPYFSAMGFAIAVSALVGQAYGAGEKTQIKLILIRGIFIITAVLLPISLAFIFIPHLIVGILNTNPEIIKNGAEYLRIVGYFEIFLGWELVVEGAFNGLGNTKPNMMIRIPLTLLRIPLAYFFAIPLKMGIAGVWWAITFSTLLKGIISFVVFFTNRKNRIMLASS